MNDPASIFANFEHQGWQAVAPKYSDVWGNLTQQFAEPILDAVSVSPGMQVLDVACGPGYVAEAAFRRGAKVTGIDFSSAMIRKAKLLYPAINFIEGDAQQLPFEDNTFDAVVMNFGVLHLSQPQKAFAQAFRVLKPGGQYGFTLWAMPENSAGMKAINDAIETYVNKEVELPVGPSAFLFCDPNECERILMASGFAPPLNFDLASVYWKVPSAQFIFDAEKEAGVRTAALLRKQTPETLELIRKAMLSNLAGFQTDEGLSIPMTAHIISIAKPG